MYKNVLIPIDRGIKTNDTCITESQEIVAEDGTIHCVYVRQENVDESLPENDSIGEEPVERARKQLSEASCDSTCKSLIGSPSDEIARYADENSIDAVVMNTHNRSGIRRLLVGSVTEDTIDKVSCPVLVLTHDEY